MLLVISSSLNADSNSRRLAREVHNVLQQGRHDPEFLDLRDLPLPFCDGSAAYGHPNTAKAREYISRADGVLCATPIYNYAANAVLKNLVELTGKAWENKVVAFACTAGGAASYMSIMGLANSLMLDFRCTIVPRFLYATEADFSGDQIVNENVTRRAGELAAALARYACALKP